MEIRPCSMTCAPAAGAGGALGAMSLRRMLALTLASSSRMEKGLVM